MTTRFKVDDIVSFENRKATFFLSEGHHTGRVVGTFPSGVNIEVHNRQGELQAFPVPAAQVTHLYAQDGEDNPAVGEIPFIAEAPHVRVMPGPHIHLEAWAEDDTRAKAITKAHQIWPDLDVFDTIRLAEYLLTGRTD